MLDFASLTLEDVLYAAPTVEAHAVLWVLHSAFWYVFIAYISPAIFRPLINKMKVREQFINLNAGNIEKMFQFTLPTFQAKEELTVLFQGIIVQHGIGASLCLPSLCGGLGLSPELANALACHGAMCEVGWEVQDILSRAYQLKFGISGDLELGKALNPLPLLVMLGFHHSCGQLLCLPMNILYHDNKLYHEMVMLLQGAALIAFMMQQYGFTLDIKSKEGLRMMKFAVIVTIVCMGYSRLFRYGWLAYMLVATIYADGHTVLLGLSAVVLVLFSLFNVVLLQDAVAKAFKFLPMTIKDDPALIQAASMASLSSFRVNRPLDTLDGTEMLRNMSMRSMRSIRSMRGGSWKSQPAGDALGGGQSRGAYEFKEGMHVMHEIRGEGSVTATDTGKVTVRFDIGEEHTYKDETLIDGRLQPVETKKDR